MTKYKSIVLNVPHASIEGLSDSNWMLGSEFFSQVKKWTDWYTDYLFCSNRHDIKMVRAGLSRFVVDTERLLDDPLEERGEGIIYKKFGDIHRNFIGNEEALLHRYYNAHQQQLRNQLSPESLLIDCHSFPSCLSDDIDICIGYNEDWSKPNDETIQTFVSVFESHGYKVGINTPYSNAISPECSFCYHSIMIELNKRIYMDEKTIELTPEHIDVKASIEEIYDTLLPLEESSFSTMPTQALVDSINSQVGCRGWTSARASHNANLIKELIRRGIDVSAIYDGRSISFLHHVILNEDFTKLRINL